MWYTHARALYRLRVAGVKVFGPHFPHFWHFPQWPNLRDHQSVIPHAVSQLPGRRIIQQCAVFLRSDSWKQSSQTTGILAWCGAPCWPWQRGTVNHVTRDVTTKVNWRCDRQVPLGHDPAGPWFCSYSLFIRFSFLFLLFIPLLFLFLLFLLLLILLLILFDPVLLSCWLFSDENTRERGGHHYADCSLSWLCLSAVTSQQPTWPPSAPIKTELV